MNATTTTETVLDVLMQLGFWPEDEPGHDWFMSDCGRVRVITDDEEIHVVAWSSNRRREIEWEASFTGSVPTAVLRAMIEKATGS